MMSWLLLSSLWAAPAVPVAASETVLFQSVPDEGSGEAAVDEGAVPDASASEESPPPIPSEPASAVVEPIAPPPPAAERAESSLPGFDSAPEVQPKPRVQGVELIKPKAKPSGKMRRPKAAAKPRARKARNVPKKVVPAKAPAAPPKAAPAAAAPPMPADEFNP